MWLFDANDNFQKFEADTGWREFWIWSGHETGWKHRSHYVDNDGNLRVKHKAFERVQIEEKLPSNYGTQSFVDDQIKNSRVELKHELEYLKKKRRRKTFNKLQKVLQ